MKVRKITEKQKLFDFENADWQNIAMRRKAHRHPVVLSWQNKGSYYTLRVSFTKEILEQAGFDTEKDNFVNIFNHPELENSFMLAEATNGYKMSKPKKPNYRYVVNFTWRQLLPPDKNKLSVDCEYAFSRRKQQVYFSVPEQE